MHLILKDVNSGEASGFFCQAENGIRDLVRSRGLGDVYKRQFQRGAGGERDARATGTLVLDARHPVLRPVVAPVDRRRHHRRREGRQLGGSGHG